MGRQTDWRVGIGAVPDLFHLAPVEQDADGGRAVGQQAGVDRRRRGRGVARRDQIFDAHLLPGQVGVEEAHLAVGRPLALVGRQILVVGAPHGDLARDDIGLERLLAGLG